MRDYISLFKSICFVSIILLIMAAFSFRPAPKLTADNSQVIEAKVVKVYKAGQNDLVFELENIKGRYYINRGLESSFDLQDARKTFLGQQITIYYPQYWTIFDPLNRTHPISKIEYQEEVVYVGA